MPNFLAIHNIERDANDFDFKKYFIYILEKNETEVVEKNEYFCLNNTNIDMDDFFILNKEGIINGKNNALPDKNNKKVE